MKRFLALFLMAVMLVTSLPISGLTDVAYAATQYHQETKKMPGFDSLSEDFVLNTFDANTKRYKAIRVNLKQLVSDAVVAGKPIKNNKGMYLCPRILAEYGLAVYQVEGTFLTTRGYGDASQNKDLNGFVQNEFRYLGYDINGKPFTNDLRVNDTPNYPTPDELKTNKWTKVDIKRDSWDKINNDSADKIFKSPYVSDDGGGNGSGNPDDLGLSDIFNPTLQRNHGFNYTQASSMTTTQLDTAKQYLKVNAEPSIATKGSVMGVHKKNGNVFYNTFILDKLAMEFTPTLTITAYTDSACTNAITSYVFGETEEEKTIYVKLSTDIAMDSIGLKGKEQDFIRGVTNTFVPLNSSKRTTITSSVNMADVANVYPLKITRNDREVQLNGKAEIEPTTDVANITKRLTAKTILMVSAMQPQLKPDEIRADFSIMRNILDVTDRQFTYEGKTLSKAIVLDFLDRSEAEGNTKIVSYKWSVMNRISGTYEQFSTLKLPSFSFGSSDEAKYFNADKELHFKLDITSDKGKTASMIHRTKVLFEEPEEPDPTEDPKTIKAYINAPDKVKAGSETSLSAYAMVTGGTVDRFEFMLDESVKGLGGFFGSKEVTFLEYDADVISGVAAYADFNGVAENYDSTKVLHPLEGVFNTKGSFKVNRTVEINSEGSFGTTYYPIDKVTWDIRPLEGQSVDRIKYHTSNVGEKIFVDFKAEGLYEINMILHSTCTYPGEGHRTATKTIKGQLKIYPDLPPVAKVSVPSRVIRDPAHYRMADYIVADLSYSPDGDEIGLKRFYVRRDTDNDKSLEDETWELIYEGLNDNVFYESPLVGLYEYRVEVEETNESVNSPFWNPVTDTRRDNTDSQPLTEKTTEIVNVAPITSALADKRSVDIVVATDYEGTKLSQLKTEVDMMIKELYEIGINLKVSFVNARKKIGSQKVPIYKYVRYGEVSVIQDLHTWTYQGVVDSTHLRSYRIPWEVRYAKEGEYLPNYGPIATSFTQNLIQVDYYSYSSKDYRFVYALMAPSDPFMRNYNFDNMNGGGFYTQHIATGWQNYTAEYRNFNFSLSGQFVKEELDSTINADLCGIDLEQVKAVKFREGTDRILLFANDSSGSTLNLDESFRQWTLANGIQVNATGASNIKDQLGYGKFMGSSFKFKNSSGTKVDTQTRTIIPESDLSEVILTTEMGANYKVDYTHQVKPIYPVATTESADTSRGVKVQFSKTHQSVRNTEVEILPDLYPMSPVNAGFYKSVEKGYYIEGEGNPGNGQDYTDLKFAPYVSSAEYPYQIVAYEVDSLMNLLKRSKNGVEHLLSQVTGVYQYERSYYQEYVFEGIYNGVKSYYRIIKTKSYVPYTTQWGEKYTLDQNFPDWYSTNLMAVGTVQVANNQISEGYLASMPKLVATEEDSIKRLRLVKSQEYYHFERVAFNTQLVFELEKTRQVQYTQDITHQYNPPKRSRTIAFGGVEYFNVGKVSEAYIIGNQIGIPIFLSHDRKTLFSYYYGNTPDGKLGIMNSVPIASSSSPIRNAVVTPDLSTIWFATSIVNEDGQASLWGSGTRLKDITTEARTLDTPNTVPKTVADLINTTTTGKYYGAFTSFKDGLKSVYNQLDYKTRLTRLVGETVTLDVIYTDYENDPLYESYVTVGHDPTALENDMGIDANNGKTIPKWDGVLNKTGLYSIKPKVRDNPNEDDRFDDYRLWNKDDMTIEVLSHRRPIAKMEADSSNTSPMYLVGTDAQSYDLDHESMANRGIVQVEWSYKRLSEDKFQKVIGPLGTQLKASVQMGETYLVAYRVKDVEGEWSYPVMKTIVPKIEMKLRAELKPENPLHKLTAFQTGNNVVFSKLWTSYPYEHNVSIQMYDGSTPILSQVLLTKAKGSVAKENTPERDWKDVTFNIPKMVNGVKLADKTYRFVVTAYDPSDATMTATAFFFVTTVSNSPPKVEITKSTPSTLYEGDEHFISIKVSDPDLDLLDLVLYYHFDGEAELKYQQFKALKSGDVVTTSPMILPNKKAIHWRAVVSDPSLSQGEAKLSKPIEAFGIEFLEVKGSWQHWRGQVNGFGEQMTNEPLRFLSLENLTFTLKTRGDVEAAALDLEAPLKAMSFVTPQGNEFQYKKLVGKTVAFPLFFSQSNSNLYKLEYILPLAPSTLGFDNNRLRRPYFIVVEIENKERTRRYVFSQESGGPYIDVTGNTYDLLYNQPASGLK